MNKILIAVLHAGTQNLTKQTIKNLKSPFPIFVINNGGEYDNDRHDVEVINYDQNLFFVGGWNNFMKEINALQKRYDFDYVWMLNNDITGLTTEIYKLLNMVALKYQDEKLAGLTPSFNSPHHVFRYEEGELSQKTRWVDWTCPAIKLSAWQHIGPFDSYFNGYGSDLDWCKRARDLKYHFRKVNIPNITHIGSQASLVLQTIPQMQYNWEMYLAKKWNIMDWTELT